MIDKKNFIKRLEKLMDGMANRPFAEKCGIDEANIRNYLKGQIPDQRTKPIEAICRACHVQVTWFDKDPISTFSDRLRHILEENHWKETDLAQSTGIDSRTIANWLHHGQEPTDQELDILARKTIYHEEWLISGHGPPRIGGAPYIAERSGRYKRVEGLVALEDEILVSVQQWLNEMVEGKGGFKIWFGVEFENRFPEYAEWLKKRTVQDNQNTFSKKNCA